MPVDTSIYSQLGAGVSNPLAVAMQLGQVRAQRENRAALNEQRAALAEERRQRAAIAAQQEADRQGSGAAIQAGEGVRGATLAWATQHAPHSVPSLTEYFDKADKSKAEIDKLENDLNNARLDHLGHLADGVLSHGGTPEALQAALALYAEQFPKEADQAKALGAQLGQLPPDQLTAHLEAQRNAAPYYQAQQQKAAERGPLKVAPGETVLGPDGKPTYTAPAKEEHSPIYKEFQDAQSQGFKGTFEQYQNADANRKRPAVDDTVPMLSPAGRDLAAKQFAMTGQLIPMGMGKQAATARAGIINRAAEMYQGLDLASQQAAYAANKDALKKLTVQRETIGAFEKTALKNIDLFLDQAGKVVDTGSPIANTVARMVSGKMLGSSDQAAYDAARQVAINEIAKITNGGGLSGVLSDSARQEIAAFNPKDATLKQTVSVLRTLKKDMENRASGLDEQIGGIRKIIATPPGQSAQTGTTIGRFSVEVKK
jgi:hypothetical protein